MMPYSVSRTGLEPRTSRPGPRRVCYSHVRALLCLGQAALEAKLFEMGSDEERATYLEEKKIEGAPAPASQMNKVLMENYPCPYPYP